MRFKLPLILIIFTFPFFGFAQNSDNNLVPNIATTKKNKTLKKLDSLGLAAFMEGRFYDSFKTHADLLKKAEVADNDYFIQKANTRLAFDFLEQLDTLSAEKSINKAMEYAIKLDDNKTLGESYMLLSFMCFVKGNDAKIRQAIDYMDKTVALNIKSKDTINLTNTYYNYLNNIIKVGYLHKGEAIINKIDEVLPMMAKSRDSLFYLDYIPIAAKFYNLKKEYNKASKYLIPYLKDPNFNKERYSGNKAMLYKEYSLSLEGLKQYKEALYYSRQYDSLKTIKFNKQKIKEASVITAEFKVNEYKKNALKSEFESQLKTEKIKNKSNINYGLIIGTLVSLFFLAHFYLTSKKRKKLVQQVNLKNQEYLKAKEEAEQLSKSKSDFFSTVSHELRTPLYGVIGLSTILLEDPSLDNHKEDLNVLKFSADYLLALINDVLEISKIDSNKIENAKKTFNIRRYITAICASFEYMLIQNKNEIKINISDTTPLLIHGDSIHLSRILMNLIGNACKFTEDGIITIDIITTPLKDGKLDIKFSISDTGIGVPKNKQKIIFEEFKQANCANYNYQGTGLGLPIVSKLLKFLDSEIHLESALGKGAQFYFTLKYETVNEDALADNQALILFDYTLLKDKKILIVDDNRINQIVTKKMLDKEGVICAVASSGDAAIAMIKADSYDAVLMDINMPGKDGIQTTKEVRQFNTTLPIIALTAVEIEEARSIIFNSGMTDFVVKPYDVKKFKQVIIKHIISAK